MTDPPPHRHTILILAVTFAGVLLAGGSSTLQLLVLTLMAGAVCAAPPRSQHRRWIMILGIVSLAIPCIAFLPAGWFTVPAWRESAGEVGIALPASVSPQPLLSFRSICLLAAGLTWLLYLTAHPWSRSQRAFLCRGFALGTILLAAAYCTLNLCSTTWPGAIYPDQYGPFPNQNQLASVLALGGILTAALLNLPGGTRRSKKITWWAGLAVIFVALIMIGSRAGFALFLAGSLVVCARRATLPKLAVVGSVALLTAAVAAFSGAGIFEKFSGENGVIEETAANGRWTLYADTWTMVREVPVTGTGLGNFADVFALHREQSAAPNRAFHPDSDLFWTLAEAGIPGFLAIGGLVAALLLYASPWGPGAETPSRRERALQMACFVASLVFAINTLIDVPAHRLGSLLPAILVLSLAIPQSRRRETCLPWQRVTFAAGVAIPVFAFMVLPDSRQPLDAKAYFAEAQQQLDRGEASAARDAFEKARFLRPDNSQLAVDEGNLWLRAGHPSLAIAAWREAIERGHRHGQATGIYTDLFKHAAGDSRLEDELWLMARGRPELEVIALARATDGQRVRELFDTNPTLRGWNRDQLEVALARFANEHDDEELLDLIARHPTWAPFCWERLSAIYASQGDHPRAFQIVASSCPVPDLSVLTTPLSLEALTSEHLRSPDNLPAALRLAHQHMRRGNQKRALAILREIDRSLPSAPPIVQFLIAHCLAQDSSHSQAREALLAYVEMVDE